MKRKISEQHVGEFIRNLGGDWKKFEDKRFCTHCHQMLYRTDNKPFDGLAVIRGHAIPIEIKSTTRNSFSFSDIKEHQREGLVEWTQKHGWPTWLALQMGVDRVNSRTGMPRRMWLVNWWSWLKVERALGDHVKLKSIPYASDVSKRLGVHEYQLGAVEYLKPYELIWIDGGWRLPYHHTFREIYLPEQEEKAWKASMNGSSMMTTKGSTPSSQLSLSLK